MSPLTFSMTKKETKKHQARDENMNDDPNGSFVKACYGFRSKVVNARVTRVNSVGLQRM